MIINVTYIEYLNKMKNYSPKTIEIYLKHYYQLQKHDFDYKKLLLNTKDIKTNSRRLMISAIKNYYKFKKDKRYEELEIPKKEIIIKNFIKYEEYKKYLKKINFKTKTGFQKRIIIRFLFETGISSSELLNIKKKNIKNNKIQIFGKGKRQRKVLLSKWLKDELEAYLKNCGEILFPFSYKNLYNKISILDKTKKISPHMFRRGYAKYCYEKGINIYDISLSMGHNNIETTVSYMKINNEDAKIYKIF